MIELREVNDGFATLENYFADYHDKVKALLLSLLPRYTELDNQMTHLYDENIVKLSDNDQEYVKKVQDYAAFEVSNKGRLKPKQGSKRK